MTTPDGATAPGQPRRPRAPTITIDTSAGAGSSPTTEGANSSTTPHASSASHKSQNSRGSISDLRTQGSFDSSHGGSRPQSPHNISSPTARFIDKNQAFLSVPSARSRQNSVDSDDGYRSSSSFSAETTLAPASSNGDRDRRLDSTNNKSVMSDPEALHPDPGTEQDFEVEDNKFAFSVGQLNKLLNPKSLSAFYALGGLAGIEKGLRSDRKNGLSIDETRLDGTISFESIHDPPSAHNSPTNGTDGSQKQHLVNDSIQEIGDPDTTPASKHRSDDSSFADRKRIYGDNRLPVKKGKSLLQLMWITYNDKVLILLSIAAAVSLAIGLYQTFGTKHDAEHPKVEWVEGVAIIVAILVVVIVGSLNDYQKERQFVKLNKKKQDRIVNVVRSGKTQEISIYDVLVGDVVLLEPGDAVPVDGIFIDGHNLKCDESQSTGESDLLKKKPADEVYAAIEAGEDLRKMDPFILSGAQVSEGVGSFMVTSTGVNSSHGKIMMSLREDPEVTPLQSKLNTLAEYIAKLGGAAGLLLFIVLFIEFLARLPHNHSTPAEKGQDFLDIFIVTVTIIVVAVPEGLPLAVTLALAFATTRMLKDNNLVRHLKACEVMGNATAICSDKTGTLTQNKMMVVAGTFGTNSRFGGLSAQSQDSDHNGDDDDNSHANSKGKQTVHPDVNDEVSPQDAVKTLSPEIKELAVHSVAINSTAFEGEIDGEKTFIGSKTETALLLFARSFLGMGPVSEERANVKVVQLIPFDSKQKCMGAVVRLANGKYRLYVKGASEILLEACTQVIRDPTKEVSSISMTEEDRTAMNNLITSYAERSLRTIGLVYRDFTSWPPRHARRVDGEQNEAVFADVFKQMVLLGIVGIQDPLREGVLEAVQTCQKAGVVVRMVTGDNMLTAKAIATDCGIFTKGGVVMEGPAFRKLSKTQMQQVIPSLQVLARSSPEDKRILVKRLKELGETVAVTGDGTNDAPALKTADVGFSMGIAGTEVAKEASAIVLMDDNFASIVKAMMWGRAVNDAVKKFLQFQVTVNITAVLLTFISAVSSGSESSVLTAVQLLWVNLIMDTMAALALATDPPTPSILDRKPDAKTASLISITMWKMIFGQAIYQLIVTLVLYFDAKKLLGYETSVEQGEIPTVVFNVFVWMQIFNSWNCRRLDNKFNIFEGITNNWFFIGINAVMVGGQVLIIFVGGKAFNVTPLNKAQWGLCIIIGFVSIPIAVLIKLIPDELIIRMIPSWLKNRSKKPKVTIEDEEQQFYFPQPLADIKEELSFLKLVKGGRLNNLKFAIQHPRETFLPRSRSGSRSRDDSQPQTPVDVSRENSTASTNATPENRRRGRSNRSRSNSALGATTVMAGIIAGSVAGWSPIERGHGENDSIRFSRSRARSDLESREGVEVHPNTSTDDPVIVEEPQNFDAPPSQVEGLAPASNFGQTLQPPQANGHKGGSR